MVEPQSGDEHHHFGNVCERIVGGAHDQGTGETLRDLGRSQVMRMRVVPVGSRASDGQWVLVDTTCTRVHRVHRIAVLVGRDRQAMPMNRRVLRKAVVERDPYALSFAQFDQRSRPHPVVQRHHRRPAGHHRSLGRRRDQRRGKLLLVRAFVGERCERTQRLPLGQRVRTDIAVFVAAAASEDQAADAGGGRAEKSAPAWLRYWHTVPGVRKTWRLMVFVCATPSTVYANVPALPWVNVNVALPTAVTVTALGANGTALNAGPVVR